MRKLVIAMVVAATFGLAACDKVMPPTGDAGTTAKPAEPKQQVQAPAFSPKLLDTAILGFYEPDYPYSLRSQSVSGQAGQPANLTMEFWGTTTDKVNASVDAKMKQMGYDVSKSNAERGYFTATYTAAGHGDVLVNISPKGSRKMYAPGAVGTIYFQWMQ